MTWKRFVAQASTLWTWLPCSRGASAAVLMMGRVGVLYRYCAVPVALLCAQVRRSSSPAALCTRGRRPARSPSAPRAFGSARRLEARPGPAATLGYCSLPHAEGVPCRRPRVPQSPRAARSPHHPPRPRSRPCARAGSRSGYEHTKSPGPCGPGDSPSGWRDLNPRPLRPERSALPSCATPRCRTSIAIPRRKSQTEMNQWREVCATSQLRGCWLSSYHPLRGMHVDKGGLGPCRDTHFGVG